MKSMEIQTSLGQIKNTVERYSSRLEQVEDRISELENKIDTIEKNSWIYREKNEEICAKTLRLH
jgi:chaperonin cofactor prefoldin